MTQTKALIRSSVFPTLSAAAGTALCLFFFGHLGFTVILGVGCGGLIPLFLIWKRRTVTSGLLRARIVFFLLTVICVMISWSLEWTWQGPANPFMPSILIFSAEIVYAGISETDFKTKLCFVLSGQTYVYTGFLMDLSRLFTVPE